MIAALALAAITSVTRHQDPDGFNCLRVAGVDRQAQGVTVTEVPPSGWASWNPFGQEVVILPLGHIQQPAARFQAREFVNGVSGPWVLETVPAPTNFWGLPLTCKELGSPR